MRLGSVVGKVLSMSFTNNLVKHVISFMPRKNRGARNILSQLIDWKSRCQTLWSEIAIL